MPPAHLFSFFMQNAYSLIFFNLYNSSSEVYLYCCRSNILVTQFVHSEGCILYHLLLLKHLTMLVCFFPQVKKFSRLHLCIPDNVKTFSLITVCCIKAHCLSSLNKIEPWSKILKRSWAWVCFEGLKTTHSLLWHRPSTSLLPQIIFSVKIDNPIWV